MSALEAVYDVLKNGANKTTGAIFMVNAPDDVTGLCVELNEAPAQPHLTMGAGIAVDAQVIEVGVRGLPRDYAKPRDEALRVRRVLTRLPEGTYAGVRILSILPIGSLTHHGRDNDSREMFTVSFTVLLGEL